MISPSRNVVTIINVFTVEPANQQQLVELLARATETSVRHAPGFISGCHRGNVGSAERATETSASQQFSVPPRARTTAHTQRSVIE